MSQNPALLGRRRLAILVGLLALGSMAAQAVTTATDGGTKDRQSILAVILAAERPVFIRLDLHVNGAAYQDAFTTAWNDYFAHLFPFADRNGDGRLSPEEAERLPSPSLVLAAEWTDDQSGFNFAFNFRVLDRDRDGSVTPDELKAYYRRYTGGPFHVYSAAAAVPRGRSLDRLFDRLDQDRDRRLSTEELSAAVSQLKALDADGDDTIAEAEISGNTAPATPPTGTPPTGPVVMAFSPSNPPSDLPDVLLSRYARQLPRPNGPSLRPIDIGLDQSRFARLDRNLDGALSAEELRGIVDCPPDCVVTLRLGHAKDGAAIEVTATADQATARIDDQGLVRCSVTGVRIELLRNSSPLRVIGANADRYLERFKAAGKNGQGTMNRKAALQDHLFASIFDLMDRDGDGILNESELRAYLNQVHVRHVKMLACRPAIVFSKDGRELFDWLDQNGDGRLSVRELREAERLPQRLDATGPLTRDSLPRNVRIGIGLGHASLSPYGGNLVVLPAERELLSAGAGPIWFRKMDRNRDGDLSPDEFLGAPPAFRRLDTDADGLISPDEAEQASPSRPTVSTIE
jgi:Ca2+-binding EF-hand superfamily protein